MEERCQCPEERESNEAVEEEKRNVVSVLPRSPQCCININVEIDICFAKIPPMLYKRKCGNVHIRFALEVSDATVGVLQKGTTNTLAFFANYP